MLTGFAAGGQIRCDDHSDFNEEILGANGVDYIMPEASVSGINLEDSIAAIVKVRGNVGDIRPGVNNQIYIHKTNSTWIRFTAGVHVRSILEIGDAVLSGVVFLIDGSQTVEGIYSVRIHNSTLTTDPLDEARTRVNWFGFIRLQNGFVMKYGGDLQQYVRSVDESIDAEFHRPIMLVRNESTSKTVTLPAASTAPVDRYSFRFRVINKPLLVMVTL